MAVSNNDLIIRFSHELGCALEMYCDPTEIVELWSEALDALRDSKQLLSDNGLPSP